VTIGASVGLAIAGNAAYDVVKAEALEIVQQQAAEARAPAGQPNDLQKGNTGKRISRTTSEGA
jgi:hypothetical protein